MASEKYLATWVSHSSINDFLTCPHSYYLKNVYKDPSTKNKVKIISPPLALGQAVHEVVESLSVISTDRRFTEPLRNKFELAWDKVRGEKGGFTSEEQESKYKQRGITMIERVENNPGPLSELAVKIKESLPHYWLSEEDQIILCGKIDWLQYIPDSESVHIIDFKTGKGQEKENSLQLPIYHLLVKNCQNRSVSKASYWYIETDTEPVEKELPDLDESHNKVLTIAKKIKLARKLESFECPNGDEGCFACKPMKKILGKQAKFVGNDEYGADVYMIKGESNEISKESDIL